MFRNVTCVQSDEETCDENKKETLIKFCNTEQCLSEWRAEKWSECSCTGVQTRFVEKSQSVLLKKEILSEM